MANAKHKASEDEEVVDKEYADKSAADAAEVMAGVDTAAVLPGSNSEVGAADSYVGSEKVPAATRNANKHAVVQNKTHSGMPSDVHQVLVGVANHAAPHAQVYNEVHAVLEKYSGSDELASDVRGHLEGIAQHLKPLAKAHAHAKVLLEKNV